MHLGVPFFFQYMLLIIKKKKKWTFVFLVSGGSMGNIKDGCSSFIWMVELVWQTIFFCLETSLLMPAVDIVQKGIIYL